MSKHQILITKADVFVSVRITRPASVWDGDASLKTVHREAIADAQGLLHRMLAGRMQPGDHQRISILGVERISVSVEVEERELPKTTAQEDEAP